MKLSGRAYNTILNFEAKRWCFTRPDPILKLSSNVTGSGAILRLSNSAYNTRANFKTKRWCLQH